ncbi:MAG: P22 phage major capsid protein family protein [Lentimicrobium sp.]|jgi:hypothetical protein|nr:P22 phage major capsid protein family protein [Lentimicrobium sp.]
MANTLITPTIVAKEALAILRNNCVYKDLVHTDFSGDFVDKVGDTVNVRVPASLTAKDFSTTISKQNITESSVAVKLDKFKDVSVAITSKEWTLSLVDFSKQVIAPAMAALGEQIDQDIANLIFEKAGSTVTRTASTPTTLADLANIAKALDIAKAPKMGRSLVMSPYHKYVYGQLDHLVKGSYAGDNDLLRRNELGPVYGIDTFMDQNTPTSTAATSGNATGTFTVASSTDAGEVDVAALSAATATVKTGDGFVYGGVLYRFTADGTGTSSAIASIAVSPTFPAGVSATTVVMVRNGSSLAFHKDAFAFVNRPLAIPQGAVRSAVASADGLSVRVIFDYDIDYKQDVISFDILYGVKELRTALAVRLVDGTLS